MSVAGTHVVHDRVLRFIADAGADQFEALALAVFAHQFEHIAAYRRVCEQRGKTPSTVHDWHDIPPVPALAFTHVTLCCAAAERTFVTSGTSAGTQQRGRHVVSDLRLYRAAAIAGLKEFLFPDVATMRLLSLIPSNVDRPDSSLAQMVAWAGEAFGGAGSAVFATVDRLDLAGFAAALRCSESDGEPVGVLSTTAALIRFFDACRDQGWSFRLPHSSRLMDTGGDKGASRPLSRHGLLHACWTTFAIPGYFCVNEYGMTELSSQYYDNVIRDRYHGRVTHRAKAGPHWLRTLVLDPAHLQPVRAGEPGLLCHVDLANVSSALAVLTEDIGRITADGLELIGRVAGAEARGCSLALDDFLRA